VKARISAIITLSSLKCEDPLGKWLKGRACESTFFIYPFPKRGYLPFPTDILEYTKRGYLILSSASFYFNTPPIQKKYSPFIISPPPITSNSYRWE